MGAMDQPSKRKPTPPVNRASQAGAASPKPKARPSLRFQLSEELHGRTLAVLKALEQAEDPLQDRDDLADLVVELTHSGLDAYFMEPLKQAKAGFVVQQSANLGMAGARQVMGSVVRNIIGRMDGPQLLSVCGSIRQFMR